MRRGESSGRSVQRGVSKLRRREVDSMWGEVEREVPPEVRREEGELHRSSALHHGPLRRRRDRALRPHRGEALDGREEDQRRS